jgi:hypothetical protein
LHTFYPAFKHKCAIGPNAGTNGNQLSLPCAGQGYGRIQPLRYNPNQNMVAGIGKSGDFVKYLIPKSSNPRQLSAIL